MLKRLGYAIIFLLILSGCMTTELKQASGDSPAAGSSSSIPPPFDVERTFNRSQIKKNSEGTEFVKTTLTVILRGEPKKIKKVVLDEDMYSNANIAVPAVYDGATKKIILFALSYEGRGNAMKGTVYYVDTATMSIKKELVFSGKNYGGYPYFSDVAGDNISLWHFSFQDKSQMKSVRQSGGRWKTDATQKITATEALAIQKKNQIHWVANPEKDPSLIKSMSSSKPANTENPILSPRWVTDAKGCKVWYRFPKQNESYTWSGRCVDGKASGTGNFISFIDGEPTGNQYKGEMSDGRFSGKGTFSSAEGVYYEGEWRDGDINDKNAKIIWDYGATRYNGGFSNGTQNGYGERKNQDRSVERGIWEKGVLKRPCATDQACAELRGPVENLTENCKVIQDSSSHYQFTQYRGACKDGLAEGKGVALFRHKNKSRSADWYEYSGYFVKGKENGYGEGRNSEKQSMRGIFVDGVLPHECNDESTCQRMREDFEKLSTCTVKAGDRLSGGLYRGECRQGLAHGKGKVYARNGHYIGSFKDGYREGKGEYIVTDGSYYKGEWKNDQPSGFGSMKYSCNCGWVFCKTCTDTGWFKGGELAYTCSSPAACTAQVGVEPLVRDARAAEKALRCEEALELDRKAQAQDGKSHSGSDSSNGSYISYSSCKYERDFVNIQNSSDPQAMYLKAAQYETDGARSRAKTVYQQIMKRHAQSPLAVKAADRLTRMSDVEAVEATGARTAESVREAEQKSRESRFDQCQVNLSACRSACRTSQCRDACPLCVR